jgi:hypothetical protein
LYILSAENSEENSAENSPPPKKKNVGENGNFPPKKVMKIHFPKKFRGEFRGKNVQKIGYWSQSYNFGIYNYNAGVAEYWGVFCIAEK